MKTPHTLAILGGLALALAATEALPCTVGAAPTLLSPNGGDAPRNVRLLIADEPSSAAARLGDFRLDRELEDGHLESVPISARALHFNESFTRVELIPTQLLEANAIYWVTDSSSQSWGFTTGDWLDTTPPEVPGEPLQASEPYLPRECAREYDSCRTYDMGALSVAFPPTSEFVTYDFITEEGETLAERVEPVSRALFLCGENPGALLIREWVVDPAERIWVRAVDAAGNASSFRRVGLAAVCEVDQSSCKPGGKPFDQVDGGGMPMPPPRTGSAGGKLGCTAVHAAFSGVLIALVLPLFRRRRSAKR